MKPVHIYIYWFTVGRDTPCETGHSIIDLVLVVNGKGGVKWRLDLFWNQKPFITLNREGKDLVHASEACMTALRTTRLPEHCEGTEGQCSVTCHLILHFHKKTEPADFCHISCTDFGDFNNAKYLKWNTEYFTSSKYWINEQTRDV